MNGFSRRAGGLVLALALSVSGPALAGAGGDILAKALYEGPIEAGIAQLTPMAEAGDQEARFGLGALRLARGIEKLTQALYRHGVEQPGRDMMLMPVQAPVNPNPEPLDYAKVRAILDALVTDMDAARADLELAGASGDYVVKINPLGIRLDINGDGVATPEESIGGSLGSMFDDTAAAIAAPVDGSAPADKTAKAPEEMGVTIGFDRADAYWLAGYSQVLAAQADFLLAHDFSALVNSAFHRLFPRAGLPMQDYSRGTGSLIMDPNTDTAIADAVSAIHSLNWPVEDPARLKGVLARFSAITALSRQNWDAIEAETDDDAELIPSPSQSATVPGGAVSAEMVAAWRATLDTADKVLAGELLVPHWRFKQGFDLKAYFETATRTDIVMLLTGYDAVPFLKDGPVASGESFAEANRVFGDNLLGYAFWFN